jgi:hypothetical protein
VSSSRITLALVVLLFGCGDQESSVAPHSVSGPPSYMTKEGCDVTPSCLGNDDDGIPPLYNSIQDYTRSIAIDYYSGDPTRQSMESG